MAGDALGPWWVGIATGIVGALAATIAKLWSELASVRREARDALAQKDHELIEAHDRIVQLQREATERGDVHQREHVRDLRRIAGLSLSVDPPPISPWPPVIVRAPPAPPRRVAKKPT